MLYLDPRPTLSVKVDIKVVLESNIIYILNYVFELSFFDIVFKSEIQII
jgi:hypothetical protein